jgi:hypothetical protein
VKKLGILMSSKQGVVCFLLWAPIMSCLSLTARSITVGRLGISDGYSVLEFTDSGECRKFCAFEKGMSSLDNS